jgi:hypothetical protein
VSAGHLVLTLVAGAFCVRMRSCRALRHGDSMHAVPWSVA